MTERELKKLIAHYENRAEHYEHEYQFSGIPSQERAWMRNQGLADALRLALNAKRVKTLLIDLKIALTQLDPNDPDACAAGVKSLQYRFDKGDFS